MKKQETRKSVDFTHYKIQDSTAATVYMTPLHRYTQELHLYT